MADSIEKGKEAMISGIEDDARSEEQKIIQEAEKLAEEKRKYGEKKIETVLNNARTEADRQSEIIKRKAVSDAELEIKRSSLKLRDTLIRDIMDRVEKKLSSMISDTSYRSVLINWIAEAAVGLDTDSARVNASQKERVLIDDNLLAEAMEKVNKQTGRQVNLTLSGEEPLRYQGVVLVTNDGRIAFNNQVRTRILRNQKKIQKLIYNTIFAGHENE